MTSKIYQAKVVARKCRQSVRGIDYAIHEWGDPKDPLIVYLHGWGDCGSTFQFVVDQFERNWFVVAPDFRGFGDSKTTTTAYWFPDYLADIDRILNHYAPDEPVRLVGHSMGANVAGLFAGSMPDRVAAFVNLEGFGLKDTDAGDAPARYRHWIEAGRDIRPFSTYATYTSLADRVGKQNPRMDRASAEFIARCWAHERNGRIVLRADPRHRLPNAVLYRRAESEACWKNIAAPVLLVMGEGSEIAALTVPLADLPFPNATSVSVPASGHMLHFEAPATIARTIEAFLLQPSPV